MRSNCCGMRALSSNTTATTSHTTTHAEEVSTWGLATISRTYARLFCRLGSLNGIAGNLPQSSKDGRITIPESTPTGSANSQARSALECARPRVTTPMVTKTKSTMKLISLLAYRNTQLTQARCSQGARRESIHRTRPMKISIVKAMHHASLRAKRP